MASRPVIAGTSAVVVALLAGTLAAPAAAQGPDGLAHDRAAQVDDLYAFVSPDRPDTATIITTWGGPQEPSDWATRAWFDPDVTYWIKVDNTGDGAADITWTFRFLTQLDTPESILTTGFGSVPGVPATVWQSVNVTRNGETMMSANVPPPNIGPRTTPGYGPLSLNYLGALDPNVEPERAGSLFVGQRDDPAFADSGALGDLLGMRPLNAKHVQPLKKAKGQDTHAGRNTQVIAIQVPIATLTADGSAADGRRCPQRGGRRLGGRQPARRRRHDPDPGVACRRSAGRGLAHPVRREGRLASRGPRRRCRLRGALLDAGAGHAPQRGVSRRMQPLGPRTGPTSSSCWARDCRASTRPRRRASRTCCDSTSPCRRPPSPTGWA